MNNERDNGLMEDAAQVSQEIGEAAAEVAVETAAETAAEAAASDMAAETVPQTAIDADTDVRAGAEQAPALGKRKKKKEKEVVVAKRELTGIPFIIMTVICVFGVLYHLWVGALATQSALQMRSMHWAIMSSVAFLVYPMTKRTRTKVAFYDWILAAVTAAASLYLFFNWKAVAGRLGMSTTYETVLGVICILMILLLTSRVIGNVLVALCLLFLAYAFLGPYMPSALVHKGTTITSLVRILYISMDGIWSTPIAISASYVVLFVVFGAFLEQSGGGELFTDIAFSLVGKKSGGPARAAVVSSGLMGMISGAAVANVVTTGTFTIPLMKRTGYKPQVAGAVEACASTGGQFMPPVMGAAAFMIAENVGVPYIQVAFAAIIPAMLYYVYLYVMVGLEAQRQGIRPLEDDEIPDLKDAMRRRGHLLIPLVFLIGSLIIGYSVGKSVVISTIMVIVISYFKKETRLTPMKIIEAMRKGVINSIPIAVACAAAGIITGVISLTGIGLRFSSVLIGLSGGNMYAMLIMTMLAAIVLGMGLPTSAAYAILSVLTVSALTKVGVLPLSAHYFIFFFGCISTITPPVALSAYAGAGIAGADPMKTGWQAFSMGFIGYIVPFLAVFSPAIMLQGAWYEVLICTITDFSAVFALTYAWKGWLKGPLTIVERIVLLVSVVLNLYTGSYILNAVGMAIFVAAVIAFRKTSEHRRLTSAVA